MKSLISLLFLLSTAQLIFPQAVDDIIEKNIKAHGGRERLAAVRTIFMEGSERSEDYYSIVFNNTIEQDKLFRTDVRIFGKRGFVMRKRNKDLSAVECWVFDPSYMRSPKKLQDSLMSIGERRWKQTPIDIAGALYNYKAKGYTAELEGLDSIKGTGCYKIKLTPLNGPVNLYWINANNYLVVQEQTIGAIGEDGSFEKAGSEEGVQSFSNFRAVEGIQFPFSAVQLFKTAKGFELIDTYYTNIEINKPVDKRLYEPKINRKL